MISKRKDLGVVLGKIKWPKHRYSGSILKIIEFECTSEEYDEEGSEDAVMTMCIIATLVVTGGDSFTFNVPCSSNYEFYINGDLTIDDLLPIWKDSVDNLNDKFKKEQIKKKVNDPINVGHPSDEQIIKSIVEYLHSRSSG